MKNKITVLVEARNEGAQLSDCITSAKLLTDTIVFIDQHSTDNSVEVAKKIGVQVIQHDPVNVVEEIREFGIRKAKTPWVFILDADERITKELAEEVHNRIKNQESRIKNNEKSHNSKFIIHNSNNIVAYKIPRKNIFGTRWLKHGGWWPDLQIRLIHTVSFKNWPKTIHSMPVIDGATGVLQNPVEHHFHGDIESMVSKTALFEEKEATLLYGAGKTANTMIFFRKFLGELYRRLVKHKGFLDGVPGIIESFYQAYSKTITYLLLYEKKKSSAL